MQLPSSRRAGACSRRKNHAHPNRLNTAVASKSATHYKQKSAFARMRIFVCIIHFSCAACGAFHHSLFICSTRIFNEEWIMKSLRWWRMNNWGSISPVGRNAFFDIDSLQSWNCGQIRTATHLPKPFKNPSHSKIIYKAIDATAFWTDLNYHTTPLVETKVNPKKMLFSVRIDSNYHIGMKVLQTVYVRGGREI